MIVRRGFLFLLTLAAGSLAGSGSLAASGGRLGTLMIGHYACERPGDAGGPPSRPEPEASFAIASSSRYIAADGTYGSYLRTGKIVQMTSGQLAGTRLQIIRPSFLRRIEADGQPGPMRCVLTRATDSS